MTAVCLVWLSLSPNQLPPPRVLLPVDGVPPPLVAPAPIPVRALSIAEFAATFQPAPGNYEVFLLHPNTGCPVCVKFCLPPGCPKVRTTKRMVTFDYGKHEVRIRFKIIGGDLVVSN